VTSPAPEPPEQQDGQLVVVLAALVALLFAGAAAAAFLALLMRLSGMHLEALRYLFRPYEALGEIITIREYPADPNTWTEPQFQQYNQNVHRRASYLVNASRRASAAYQTGGIESLRQAYEREKTYWAQHKAAAQRRTEAAARVGEAMEHYSSVRLGWYAQLDERTSPECRQAHGANFDPNRIPAIGYPGSVHPHCRCHPGAPFATRRRVESIRPDRRSA
jgi:hypothetical protein